MHRVLALAFFGVGFAAMVAPASADDERYVMQNGIRYRELRETVSQPVAEVRMEEREVTTYRRQNTTRMQEFHRTVYVPVTQYHREQHVRGWLNPFQPLRVTDHWVPRTHWQPRVEKIKAPVAHVEWIPESRTVQQPVRTLRMVTKVETRLVPAPEPSRRPSASREPSSVRPSELFGGVARLDSDPPRISTRPQSWSGTIRR